MRMKHNNTLPIGTPGAAEPVVVVALRSVAVAPSVYRIR